MDLEEGQFHHRYHPPLPFHQYLLHPFIHRICIIFLQPMQTTSKQWDQGKIWFIRTIFAGISLSITLHPIHNWHPNHVSIFWNFCWFIVFIAFLILFDFFDFYCCFISVHRQQAITIHPQTPITKPLPRPPRETPVTCCNMLLMVSNLMGNTIKIILINTTHSSILHTT